MIDTDNYEHAKKIVEDAGLIDDNDGWLDVHYRKIANLLAEVKRLRDRIDEFGFAVNDMLPLRVDDWYPGDYDEVEINGKRKIIVDEDWRTWMHSHIETLLFPQRYHVEGKRYNHLTYEWEEMIE